MLLCGAKSSVVTLGRLPPLEPNRQRKLGGQQLKATTMQGHVTMLKPPRVIGNASHHSLSRWHPCAGRGSCSTIAYAGKLACAGRVGRAAALEEPLFTQNPLGCACWLLNSVTPKTGPRHPGSAPSYTEEHEPLNDRRVRLRARARANAYAVNARGGGRRTEWGSDMGDALRRASSLPSPIQPSASAPRSPAEPRPAPPPPPPTPHAAARHTTDC